MNRTQPRLLKRKSMRQRHRENEMARDYAQFAHGQYLRANMMVCAILAQVGDVTLTQGTLDQCVALIETIGYEMEETKPKAEYRLRLVLGEAPVDLPVDSGVTNSPSNIVITGI